MSIHTPWGSSQTIERVADGIRFISTASHGGYHLSPERWAVLIAEFPAFKPWAGPQWLEEDCDCALVVLTWPELFTDHAVFFALRSGREWQKESVTPTWEASDRAQAIIRRHDTHREQVKTLWEKGGMWAPVEGAPAHSWGVMLSRGSERRTVIFPSYPTKEFYSDAELADFELAGAVALMT